MSKENKNWTEHHDHVLKHLREEHAIRKWSLIAQKMQTEFKITGKSGKKCRERYQNHLNKEVRRDDWTKEEEDLLLRLHDQKGNKWVEIATILERSDNAVKNYYHSKLRKALRKINYLISTYFRNQFKPLKNNIISKILHSSQKPPCHQSQPHQINSNSAIDQDLLSNSLKNRFLNVLSLDDHLTETDISYMRSLIKQINQFSKAFKNRIRLNNQRPSETGQHIRAVKYKGKEILSLINENKQKEERQVHKDNQQEESLSNHIQQKLSINSIAPQFKLHMNTQLVSNRILDVQQPIVSFFQHPCQPFFMNYLSCNYVIQSHTHLNYSFYPSSAASSSNLYHTTSGLPGSQPQDSLIEGSVKREAIEEIYFSNKSL